MVFHGSDGAVRLDGPELEAQADELAARLIRHGILPGDRVGLLGPNHPRWLASAFGIWRAGAVMVSLSYPLRVRNAETFRSHVAILAEAAGCRAVLAAPAFLPAVAEGLAIDWSEAAEDPALPVTVSPESPASIQFTSGSTAAPKGALLSHRAVLSALTSLREATKLGRQDRMISWQPFFHDMGFYGLPLRAAFEGFGIDLMTTEAFARDPGSWFRLAGERRSTIIASPPSAWAAAVTASRRDPEPPDLSSVALAVFGAEVIDPATVEMVAAWGEAAGLRREALAAAYGMAEATICMTITRRNRGLRVLALDRDALQGGHAVPANGGAAKRVVSNGPPLPGIDIRIGDPEAPLGEGHVGDVLLRGAGLMDGYIGPGVEDPFVGGWLRTGDLGFIHDGEVYITGRSKDLIIVFGRNYAPEDLEWAAGAVAGVRTGRVVAFSPSEEEGAVIVAVEPRPDADLDRLPVLVRRAVADKVGLTPNRVLVLPPDTIEKTTSGKLRRSALREAFDRGAFP
jgi:acyl-CoA synthetase (AMP-forming)/AMP-acid ligase II